MNSESLKRQLEELQLIQCSLLPTEHLTFLDDTGIWTDALRQYSEDSSASLPDLDNSPFIGIHVDGAKIWFEVKPNEEASKMVISVKGEGITRAEQEHWRSLVVEKMEEISDSEFPMYQLVSLHLLPLLHEEVKTAEFQKFNQQATVKPDLRDSEPFHVLFTSHHLISPNKRRSLQQWCSSLSLTGFAKVGYPGVIYAQGERTNIEEFVDNVKAMQWLALKVRFVEPLPIPESTNSYQAGPTSWKEFQKVGEVVEEMRRIGREEYVVEMGIGSAGVNTGT
ncbi:hypothetical protein BJ912DRAFT_164558 [Pholiota molesta]|nr:hypothetical protein BJ912DRAFT_164558 [Pholiota molesta]